MVQSTDERSLLTSSWEGSGYQTLPYSKGKYSKANTEHSADVPCLTSCRWMTSYMCFLGMVLVFAVRANLVMALVCILPKPALIMGNNSVISNLTNSEGARPDEIYMEIGENRGNGDTNTSSTSIWTDKAQGLALSSYYYGSIISPIFGGYVATKSAKYVMVALMAASAIVTIVTPFAMLYNVYIITGLRILIGLFGGMYEPAMQHLMASWSPKQERGKLTALSQSGKVVGNVVSFILSGILCSVGTLGGWPLTFYGTGVACLLWSLAVMVLIYDDPNKHPRISESERLYVISHVTQPKEKSKQETTVMSTPWLEIMTSLPVIACLIVKLAGAWVFNVQSSNQPMWMRDVLHFNVEKNGIFSSLPYIGQFLGSLTAGVLLDLAIHTRLSTTIISKISISLCFLLPAAGYFSLAYLTERERTLAVIITILITTIYSTVPVTLRVVVIELAPQYTGILMGVVTTIGCIPGMLAPLITSILTAKGSQGEWALVFYMCSGVYAGAALFYLIFSKAEEQKWSK